MNNYNDKYYIIVSGLVVSTTDSSKELPKFWSAWKDLDKHPQIFKHKATAFEINSALSSLSS